MSTDLTAVAATAPATAAAAAAAIAAAAAAAAIAAAAAAAAMACVSSTSGPDNMPILVYIANKAPFLQKWSKKVVGWLLTVLAVLALVDVGIDLVQGSMPEGSTPTRVIFCRRCNES